MLSVVPAPQSAQQRRDELFALLGGRPVHLTYVDLVGLSNEEYDGLDPDVDLGTWTAAQIALDAYLYRVGDQRAVGGPRARDIAYDYCRYVLPFLLEHRADVTPLGVGRLRTSDLDQLARILAGERALPAATVAAGRLGRLALTCHWLTLDDAATACRVPVDEVHDAISAGKVVPFTDQHGTRVVRASDLRRAGLLQDEQKPHGLGRGTADNVLALLRTTWERAENLGVPLVGKAASVVAKEPLAKNRGRAARAQKRVRVRLRRVLQVAAHLHPVHQLVLWMLALLGARDGEVFAVRVKDYEPGWLWLSGVGGQVRDVRDGDGRIVRADSRAGTKGSVEGLASPGADSEPTDGVLTRWVPVAPALCALIEYVIATCHTDPVTGEVDGGARLVPGLTTDDRSGLSAFTGALRLACAETAGTAGDEPVDFTPHDLRASLNTALTNAGVDGRLLRYFLGHASNDGKALDVHDRHYDLGPDSADLATVATAVQSLVLPEVTDLRVPTFRLPQWGSACRLRARSTDIERQWRMAGWYKPTAPVVPPEQPADEVLDADDCESLEVAAAELGVSPSQLKRDLQADRVQGFKRAWGTREVWAVPRQELDRVKAVRAQITVPQLAAELGMGRIETWRLVRELGLGGGRDTGEHIRLSTVDADLVRVEARHRAEVAAGVMTTAAAADELGLPEGLVQTLARRRQLVLAAGPMPSRLMYVTVASVRDYALRHPAPPQVGDDEPVVPIADVRHVLGVSRHVVTHLVCSRELAVVWVHRRQHVGVRSLERYIRRHPQDGAVVRLAVYSVVRT